MYELFDKDGNSVLFRHSIDARDAIKAGHLFGVKPEKNTKGPKVEKKPETKVEKKPETKSLPTSLPKTEVAKVKRGPK